MQFKECNTCGRNMPDTVEYFDRRLKKGGIWGTTAKCRRCLSEARKFNRTVKQVKKLMAERGLL